MDRMRMKRQPISPERRKKSIAKRTWSRVFEAELVRCLQTALEALECHDDQEEKAT